MKKKSDIHYLSYPLQYVEAELLASQLSQNNPPLLSKTGKVFADKQNNNLIFEDTQRHIERLQSWLKKKLIYLNNKSKSRPILSIKVEKLYMSWVSFGNLVLIKSIK
ncbi:secretin N-terminal domain-containing protein [Arsenophonus endosymbiont of Aleurodicus floccissimus]|uniref:secretin N-terminal domain-containing protein n=1 Tax=Arsenophonus endosymbiont of Aleurodicus floccissimus TaxID=2152761 RepID=UPI000E6B4630